MPSFIKELAAAIFAGDTPIFADELAGWPLMPADAAIERMMSYNIDALMLTATMLMPRCAGAELHALR